MSQVCASPRNSTWFTRPFLHVRGWGLGTRLKLEQAREDSMTQDDFANIQWGSLSTRGTLELWNQKLVLCIPVLLRIMPSCWLNQRWWIILGILQL